MYGAIVNGIWGIFLMILGNFILSSNKRFKDYGLLTHIQLFCLHKKSILADGLKGTMATLWPDFFVVSFIKSRVDGWDNKYPLFFCDKFGLKIE